MPDDSSWPVKSRLSPLGAPGGPFFQEPQPVAFDDADNGCPGFFIKKQNRTAGICYTCPRYCKPGPQIKPRADLILNVESGRYVWDCPDRRPQE